MSPKSASVTERLCCDGNPADLPGGARLQRDLSRVVRLFCMLSREHVSELSITGLQGYALMGLQILGPISMTEISEYTRLSVSTMTRVVDRLVEMGLVKRAHPEHDRRVVRLELTAAGMEKTTQFRLTQGVFFELLLQGLSAEEREAVLSSLTLLARRMEALAAEPPDSVPADLALPPLAAWAPARPLDSHAIPPAG